MGFVSLEYSVDATPAVMLSPAVAMAAEVHCKRPPAGGQWLADYLHDASTDASRWLVITQRWSLFVCNRRAQDNCRDGVAENSNQANPIKPVFSFRYDI